MATPVTGGCLCGAVRYTVAAPVTNLRACHCKNCQKSSGGGGTVNAVVPSDSFKITKGMKPAEAIEFRPSPERNRRSMR